MRGGEALSLFYSPLQTKTSPETAKVTVWRGDTGVRLV